MTFYDAFTDELDKIAKEDGGEPWHPTPEEKKGKKGWEPRLGWGATGGAVGAAGLLGGAAEASVHPGRGTRRKKFLKGGARGSLAAAGGIGAIEGGRALYNLLKRKKKE
jgi:hypothetical protein